MDQSSFDLDVVDALPLPDKPQPKLKSSLSLARQTTNKISNRDLTSRTTELPTFEEVKEEGF
jgi:hypothetical protein